MLNKKVISLDFKFGGPTRLFLCSRIPETRGRKRWRIPVESQPFCSLTRFEKLRTLEGKPALNPTGEYYQTLELIKRL